ncbi:holo-ACP synthase [Campylobacter sp. MIT 99-7217]|uniref:holo-ACP synthase n=1 Tax=Campylobacter sp. MIT 99-7217 TaxID=535091 RepID=UPI00115C3B1B|nr:holo-ACP synthase [Campylobacter sp. MIT 99-7217]TQR34731.1 holo-ACP synthase [Campylobacter sp. MIT 99-7217]
MLLGCDISSISRIEKIYKKYGKAFLDKFLNSHEQALIKSPATLAGFFAAKEAVSKALGVGICKECSFFDIEIYKDSKNAPKLRLSARIMENFRIKTSALSISHDGNFAIAVAVLEK